MSEPSWPTWLASAPRLLAESLVVVADPLAAWLRPGPVADAGAVAAALARAMLPPAADDPPPRWLRPDQALSFRRALAAVRAWRGALLADPVGSGKTWIALAVVRALDPAHPAIVVAPAVLRSQWHDAARRTAVEIVFHSHELLSRGRAPGERRGPVIVDESHRFRNADTRRYGVLAPWCVGRRGLLLTATPAVNRIEDVAAQLLLLVRDDALAWAGVRSLEAALRTRVPGALAHLLVTGEDRSRSLPARAARIVRPAEPDGSPADELLAGIGRLTLSPDPAVAGLLRVSLLVALASSPAAITATLRRYRLLLLHAADAARAGRSVSRATIRRMAGGLTEQLVLWPFAGPVAEGVDLEPDDLVPAGRLLALARSWSERPDAKVAALGTLLEDGHPSIVFTTAIATVRYIRRHLGRRGVAWCSGHGAGLDGMTAEREAVLDWFRSDDGWPLRPAPPPTVLIATDVAAEGLDLRRVERVVHYDLPWTAVRLEQRAGRALRLGSTHREVELVRFAPADGIRHALEQERILELKAELPATLGLGAGLDAPWRRSAAIASRWENHAAIEGVAARWGDEPATIAGYRLRFADGRTRQVVLLHGPQGWSDDSGRIARGLEGCRSGAAEPPRAPKAIGRILRSLEEPIRDTLAAAHAARLGAGHAVASVRRVRRRLLRLARAAARARRERELELCERGLAQLRAGRTAGEAREIATWAGLPDSALRSRLARLAPPEPAPSVESVELVGILAVERRRTSR